MAIIYLHKNNKDNCKVYIGKTIQKTNRRWSNGNGYLSKKKDKSEQGWHYCQPRMAEAVLNSDWEKDWDHRILEDLGDCSQKELNAREAYWINYFDATNPLYGYNTMHKAEGSGTCSDDTKLKISKANKGKILSDETKNKISKANTGKKRSEESKKINSEKHKNKIHSEDTRKKTSESLKKYYENNSISENTRNKISESLKGHKVSEESRKRMSESQKKRFNKDNV